MSNKISRLKGADKIRQRVGVMLGSDDINGVKQTLFEIVSNSIDRFKAGYGDTINVIKHKDLSYSVEDFADGLPMAWNNKENAYDWELTTRVLYAGGNYNVDNSKHVGQLGINGLGLAASVLSSENATIISYRDNNIYIVKYHQGRPIHKTTGEFLCEDGEELFSKELGNKVLSVEKSTGGKVGTKIWYKPDINIFTETDIPTDWICDKLKKQAVVNKGLKLNIIDEMDGNTYSYHYENGINDYVQELITDNAISDTISFSGSGTGRDSEKRNDYNTSFDISLVFCTDKGLVECYHNSSELIHGGSPLKAIELSMVNVFHNYIKDSGLYSKNETRVRWTDIEDSLVGVISSYSSVTSYSNQTKTSISNKFIQDFINESIREQFTVFMIENPLVAERIAKQILVNKRSRERAELTRVNIKKKLGGTIDVTNRVKKFVDCRTKDISQRELYIVEGDSALGSCKMGRDSNFQGLMPIRGKTLNCLKADYDRIFKSDIIVDLMKLLGCGIEVKSKHNKELNTFDLDKLQWGKVIICTDSDVDGFQIRTLLLTMFYRLCPTLIKESKIYIVESPLYEIQSGDVIEFAHSDAERDTIASRLGKCHIQRSKGLGENDPDMMWNTTMNPETRKLIQVTMNDIVGVQEEFERLLGDDLDGRKQYITDNFDKYLEVI